MSFTCPVCLRVKQKNEHVALNSCEHHLCWTCCGKLMRENLTVAVKCPLCRATESERALRRIRRAQADEADSFVEPDETVADDDDDYNDYEEYDDDETIEEGEIVDQRAPTVQTIEDFSDYQNNFVNGRFSFRYTGCRFITINK